MVWHRVVASWAELAQVFLKVFLKFFLSFLLGYGGADCVRRHLSGGRTVRVRNLAASDRGVVTSPVDVALLELNRCSTCLAWDRCKHSSFNIDLKTWRSWDSVIRTTLVAALAMPEAWIEHCALGIRHQRT